MNKYIILLTIISLKLTAGEALIYEKKIHADSIDSLCLMKNDIISASFDGNIKKTTDTVSKTVGKHKDWVRKVICDGENIISASNDGFISIWNDLKIINTVQAHSWWVTDIALTNNKIISVSLDESVKVWSYPGLKLLYSRKLHGSNKHYSVITNNGVAFIGSTRGLLTALELDDYSWVYHNYIVDVGSILSFAKTKYYIFLGTSDGYIVKVKALKPYNRILKVKISASPIKTIVQRQGFLYVGDSNGVLRKINIENFTESYVINRFPEAVQALAINHNSIYVGYKKGYIRKFINKAEK